MLEGRKYGFKNESDIINYLNGKQFFELDDKWKKHILRMFPFVEDKDYICAHHYEEERGKPDVVIRIRHTNQYVSIKTGRNPGMHQEPFESFASFLRKKGVSNRTLQIMKFYQYGETEKLNNGGQAFKVKELEEKYGDYFLEASKELDKTEIIEAVIFRTILKGCLLKRYKVNYLYFGNLETGYLLSEEDIYRLVLNYRGHDKSAIHFGGLNFFSQCRDKNKSYYQDCRIRWPILALLYYKNEQELKDIISGKIIV